ncbi:SKP1 interacting partner 6 [Tasmannia lanceolata]|uniref:SKP1 interacting partner 6 n=1 Tax=Tasmannia lanceolata TaxID=3420 RepID=UPI0040642CBA
MDKFSNLSLSDSSQTLLPNLPNDVALQCIARVPRSFHPNLSLVSKSWHSLLHSPLFFSTRSHLNLTQQFLYINIRIHLSSSFKWFLLDLSQNPKKLSPLPPLPSPIIGSSCVVLGPLLFVLGGSVNEIPKSTVWIFDARINRWEIGPRMRVNREFAASGVLNGKIYVLGGCLVDSWTRSLSWAEVLDPEIGSWAPVPSPVEVRERWMHGSAVLGGKFFAMADRGGVVFDVEGLKWGCVPIELDLGWRGRGVVVDEILYCYDFLGKIRGYDVDEDRWKELKGIGKELPRFLCGATLANAEGRLCVIWEKKGEGKLIDIACGMIEVCKESGGELRGSVVWSEVILTIPNGSSIVHCLAIGL